MFARMVSSGQVVPEAEKICPKCGAGYTRTPALSREDSQTLICPDCGTREALASMGVSREEQEEIIETIHKSNR